MTGVDYCLDMVRKWDHDRLLTALFVSASTQRHWLAVMALNVELSMIRDAVSEVMLGHIRYQWWHDQLADLGQKSDSSLGHPVLQAMKDLMDEGVIDMADLAPLISARDKSDLEEAPFFSQDDLLGYVQSTAGQLQLLQAKIALGPTVTSELERAIKAVGTAYGLIGMARSVDYHASRGRCLIPTHDLQQVGLTSRDVLNNPFEPRFEGIYHDIVKRAEGLLTEARVFSENKRWANFSVFQVGVLAKQYARRLRHSEGNLVNMKPYTPLRKQLHLTRAQLSRRF